MTTARDDLAETPPDLSALGAEAASLSREAKAASAPAGTGEQPGEPVRENTPATIAQEWAGGVEMGAAILVASMPELASVYTADKVKALGAAVGAVAAKHGWRLSSWLDAYKEEIALLMVAVPLLRETLKALKARNGKKADPIAKGNDEDPPREVVRPSAPAATGPTEETIKPN